MSDPPLTAHPETGEPVRRVFGTPNAPKSWTDSQRQGEPIDKNLERMGFTKYVKSDAGKYEKVVGKGPDRRSGSRRRARSHFPGLAAAGASDSRV